MRIAACLDDTTSGTDCAFNRRIGSVRWFFIFVAVISVAIGWARSLEEDAVS